MNQVVLVLVVDLVQGTDLVVGVDLVDFEEGTDSEV